MKLRAYLVLVGTLATACSPILGPVEQDSGIVNEPEQDVADEDQAASDLSSRLSDAVAVSDVVESSYGETKAGIDSDGGKVATGDADGSTGSLDIASDATGVSGGDALDAKLRAGDK